MEVEDGRSLLGGFADGFDGFGLGCGSLISLGPGFGGSGFGLCGAEGLGFGDSGLCLGCLDLIKA